MTDLYFTSLQHQGQGAQPPMNATSMSSREFAERLDSVAKGIRRTAEQRAKVRSAGRIKAVEVLPY